MKKAYFLCSPSLGIIDSWLPIIYDLKKKEPTLSIEMIIPKSGAVDQIERNNVLLKLAEPLFDSMVFKTLSGAWVKTDSIFEIPHKNGFINKIENKLYNLSFKIKKYKFLFAVFISIYEIFDRIRFRKNRISLRKRVHEGDILLFDIYEEHKDYNDEITDIFKKNKKFSVSHGIDIHQDEIIHRPTQSPGTCKVFLYSEHEKKYYQRGYGLSESDLVVTGIARHNKDWINAIRLNDKEPEWDNYIFVISRSVSSYFPADRKQKSLSDIKELALKYNLKILIKKHPKERDNHVYEKIFGIMEKGVTWNEVSTHSFTLAPKCLFAISFYSGVSVDMIFNGVPCIEYLNLKGISEHDNELALRDAKKSPVLSFRYLGFVYGVDNKEELFAEAKSIMNSREEKLEKLRNRYRYYFNNDGGGLERISKIICDSLK